MINKLINSIKSDGVFETADSTIKKTINFVLIFLSNYLSYLNKYISYFSIEENIHRRRINLSNILFEQFRGTVAYGPFKGFQLGDKFTWGKADAGSMIFGFYEKEVLDFLVSVPATHKTLIDLGAADGYYSVGCLVNNLFEFTYCYEISELSRENIKYCSELNNVSKRIAINGMATADFYMQLIEQKVDLSKCFLLCDIEGGEFDVFNEKTFEAFKGAVILIEIHEWHQNGKIKYEKLKQEASQFFNITEITMGSRDLSIFPELSKYHDSDRWLLCSEGRGQLMTWLKLEPK
jgi:hypothetical protein